MSDRPRRGVFAGALLLGLGVVLLVTQFVPQIRALDLWSLAPLAVGVAFLAAYAYGRHYGLLIAGCLLTGLGMGALLTQLPLHVPSEATVVGLGLGFIAVYPTDLAVRGRQPGQWWPLVPGVIIVFTGIAPALWNDFWRVAPAAVLIVIGIGILARAFMPGAAERDAERQARRAERRARRHGGAVPPSPAAPGPPEPKVADKIEPATDADGTDAPDEGGPT